MLSLDGDFSESEAQKQFRTIADWGRYAELFEYDADEERLYPVEVGEDVEETRD
jgi:NitT/TauT family transport system ATP-binding protein